MAQLIEPSKALFDQYLQEEFALVLSPSDRRCVRLISVEGLQSSGKTKGRESFSLVFCAPPQSRLLPQGVYRVDHSEIGELEIFLVPIGPDPEGRGMRMEAVFNFVT